MKVVLATSNAGKVAEIEAILTGSTLQVVSLPLWLGEVETGASYEENARLKAGSAVRVTGMPVLAEDSGLEVDAIGGLPGLRSARFAGPGANDDRNVEKLLRLLDAVDERDRSARYRAAAVLVLPSGAEVVGAGVWEGTIALEPKGKAGFGYDPVFVPSGEGRTVADLPLEEKNRRSHRAQALSEVLEALRN